MIYVVDMGEYDILEGSLILTTIFFPVRVVSSHFKQEIVTPFLREAITETFGSVIVMVFDFYGFGKLTQIITGIEV